MSDNIAYLKYGVILLIISAVAFCITCWPVFRKINLRETEIYELLDNLNQADADTEYLISLNSRINILKDRILNEHKIIPVNDDLPGLRSKLGKYIGQLPLNGHNFKKGKDIQSNNLNNLTLKVDTSGEFVGVFQLIHYIESLPRLIRIREVKVTKNTRSNDDEVNASITIDAFYKGYSDGNNSVSRVSG